MDHEHLGYVIIYILEIAPKQAFAPNKSLRFLSIFIQYQ